MCRKEKPARAAVAAALAIALILFAACKGPAGPGGPVGPEGPTGQQGTPGVDFPANWRWQVTFLLDGGSWTGGAVPDSFVVDGGRVPAPGKDPVKSSGISDFSGLSGLIRMAGEDASLGFLGWAKEDGSLWDFGADTVTEDIALTALWSDEPQIVYGAESLVLAFDYIRGNHGRYVLAAAADNILIDNALMLSNGSDLTIICDDYSDMLYIATAAKSPVFVVSGAGTKLTLKGNIALCGRCDTSFNQIVNAFPQVRVEAGANFVIEEDILVPDPDTPGSYLAPLCVFIAGNINNSSAAWNNYGASGVYITGAGSTFTMNGGSIQNNLSCGPNSAVTANAAVGIGGGGNFIMNGGTIENNTGNQGAVILAGLSNNGISAGNTFSMHGGTIENNENSDSEPYDRAGDEISQWAGHGGIVNIQNGIFIMTNGEIINNSPSYNYDWAQSNIAIVYVNGNDNAAFIMRGGVLVNSGGCTDIYVGHGGAAGAGSLTLGSGIEIGAITLYAAPSGANTTYEADNTFIKLAGPITTTSSIIINLQANNYDVAYVTSIWKGRVVLQGTQGFTIGQDDVDNFILGEYCGDGSNDERDYSNYDNIPSNHVLTGTGSGTNNITLYQP